MSNFNEVVESLLVGMNKVMGAKTVVGEATKVGDTIIVPLVDVSFGVGAVLCLHWRLLSLRYQSVALLNVMQ